MVIKISCSAELSMKKGLITHRIKFDSIPSSQPQVLEISAFPTRSDTNQAVQPHKIARGLKFRIKEVEGLYYSRNDITTLALYGHGSETILFFSMGHGKVKVFSLRYFATKFNFLMFSNIFYVISTFTVELKVYFLLFYQNTCVNMKHSHKTHFK